MTIKILNDAVDIDGVLYRKVSADEDMWGLKDIAIYFGHFHKDGTPNVNNLYHNTENEMIKFPNFDRKAALGGKKPWTKKQVLDWLSIPKMERKAMYREHLSAKGPEGD